jgi:hypothetical protein
MTTSPRHLHPDVCPPFRTSRRSARSWKPGRIDVANPRQAILVPIAVKYFASASMEVSLHWPVFRRAPRITSVLIRSPGRAGFSSALRASVLETGGINLHRRAQAPFPWDFKGAALIYFSKSSTIPRLFSSISLTGPNSVPVSRQDSAGRGRRLSVFHPIRTENGPPQYW